MDKLDVKEIKHFYENVDGVWPLHNKWHDINQLEIKSYIKKLKIEKSYKILNAGSGGNNYGLSIEMYHMDIAANKILNQKNFVVGSIEAIPFEDETFDVVICVGSVLNYCDAISAITEMSRVLKRGGLLVIEFENSYSFEFKNTTAFKSNAAIITTSYFNRPHKMWVFSSKYICRILQECNMKVNDLYAYHILSSIAYYYIKDENKAAKYSVFDKILRHIPFIHRYSGNIILCCTKK